jgi:hypothetical protein
METNDDTVEVAISGSPGHWHWHKITDKWDGRRPRDPNEIYTIPRTQYEYLVAQRQSIEKIQERISNIEAGKRKFEARIQRELDKVAKVNPNEPGFLVTREQIMEITCSECGARPGEYCTTRWSGNRAKDLHFMRKADRDDLEKESKSR